MRGASREARKREREDKLKEAENQRAKSEEATKLGEEKKATPRVEKILTNLKKSGREKHDE